jgi:sortase B
MPITFANETQKKEYITKIRRMSEPSIKLDDKKIDRIYTFVTCSYERDDNRTYVHAVEE